MKEVWKLCSCILHLQKKFKQCVSVFLEKLFIH